MTKSTYVLIYGLKVVAVILADKEPELKKKISRAIKDETCAETDGQFFLKLGEERGLCYERRITCEYVNNGCLITDQEFKIIKTTLY